jgi:hypothetical protein
VAFNGLSSVVTNDDVNRNLALQINAEGKVTYAYTPVPEPSSSLRVGMAGLALAAFRLHGARRGLVSHAA